MATFDVRTNTLETAASSLENAIQAFEGAAREASAAGDALTSNWDGDAKNKFQEEQTKVKAWYADIANAARSGVQILKNIARMYQEADADAASRI